jgi:hypothetical protein
MVTQGNIAAFPLHRYISIDKVWEPNKNSAEAGKQEREAQGLSPDLSWNQS